MWFPETPPQPPPRWEKLLDQHPDHSASYSSFAVERRANGQTVWLLAVRGLGVVILSGPEEGIAILDKQEDRIDSPYF